MKAVGKDQTSVLRRVQSITAGAIREAHAAQALAALQAIAAELEDAGYPVRFAPAGFDETAAADRWFGSRAPMHLTSA